MPWKLEFDATSHVVDVLPSGVVTARDLEEGTAVAYALARDQETNRFFIQESPRQQNTS